MATTTMSVVLTVALLVVATSRVAEGQSNSNDCVSKLTLCAQYLNTTTTPGAECCDAIKSVVTTQLDCLCRFYNQPGGLRALGIDPAQALDLPRRCNIPNDVSACNALAPGSSVVPPPPGAPDTKNGVDRISWMGMPALLLVSATVFLY